MSTSNEQDLYKGLYVNFWEPKLNAVIDAGREAIKSAIIINGAAAIALLTFTGNFLANKDTAWETIPMIGCALWAFMFGVGCGGISSLFRFGALFCLQTNRRSCEVSCAVITAVTLLLSFVFFFYGSRKAYQAFLTLML